MRTGEAARALGLSAGRVRRLTEYGLPRPLPCDWIGVRCRIFDMDAILKWAQEREQFFDGDPQHPGPNSKFRAMRKAQTVARHRERLSEKYAGKLGVTEALLDRWAKKGWR